MFRYKCIASVVVSFYYLICYVRVTQVIAFPLSYKTEINRSAPHGKVLLGEVNVMTALL